MDIAEFNPVLKKFTRLVKKKFPTTVCGIKERRQILQNGDVSQKKTNKKISRYSEEIVMSTNATQKKKR